VLSGAELSGEPKTRFAAIQERQAELSQKFSENVLDATDQWSLLVSPADMVGMSNTFFNRRNSRNQEDADHRQIRSHQRRQSRERDDDPIDRFDITHLQGTHLHRNRDPHTDASNPRRPRDTGKADPPISDLR